MAKRSGDPFTNNNISKRKKLDNHDETLWDDDLDDNCFDEIANKIFEKDDVVQATQENSSILLSYDSFKPNIPYASTQDTRVLPTDFKRPQTPSDNEEMKMKLTYLQQKCEAKEGEVSILRAQMKKIRSDMVEDQSKKQKEYLEMTNLKEKEIKSIKGQLDFKDLEISNLKQKILEISRANFNTTASHEFSKRQKNDSSFKGISTHINIDNIPKVTTDKEKDFETSILIEPEYIAYSKRVSDFFETFTPEIHLVETRVNQFGRNTIPYLHNQMVQEELTVPSGPKLTARIDDREVTLEHIYTEVFALFQSNIWENNAEHKNNIINKLLGVSIQLLKNLMQYFDQLENIYRTEDIEQLDRVYLQRTSKENDCEQNPNINCEIGVRAGRTVQVIAEILPYNDYMKGLLLSNGEFNEDFLSNDTMKDLRKKNFYFLLLNDIVRKIFSLRKSQVCTTFLQGVATILLAVSKENLFHNIFPAFSSLVASVLFTRPSAEVLYKLLVIIKNCSESKNFLDFLCQKPDNKKFSIDRKRKLNYFSEESCKFTIFVSLLNNALQDMREEELLDVTSTVLSFVDIIFTSNSYWVHDQQKDRCICLEQLYQLIIEVLYWTVLKFQKNKNNSYKDKYISIFKCGIKVLELLFFNSYDSIETFIDSYSRYKEICKSLMELEKEFDLTEETFNLDKLCLSEEVIAVSSSSFELI